MNNRFLRMFTLCTIIFMGLTMSFSGPCTISIKAVHADWPTFLGDATHSMTPSSNVPEFPILDWQLNIRSEFTASPVADSDSLFAGGVNGRFYAIDLTTQKIRWSYLTHGPIRATALIDGDFVYCASGDGKLYAFRKTDGRIYFTYDTGASIYSSPTLSGNTILIATTSIPKLLAIDKSSGSLLYEISLPQTTQSSPIIMGNTAILGTNDGTLRAFSLSNGTALWTFSTTGNTGFHSPVALDSNTVLFVPGALNHILYAINIADGSEVWRYTGGTTGIPHAPAPPSVRLSFSSQRRVPHLEQLLVKHAQDVQANNGAPSLAPSNTPSYYVSPYDPSLVYTSMGLATDANNIYFVQGYPEAILLAIDRNTHSLVWSKSIGVFPEPMGFYPTPMVYAGRIYISNSNGLLEIFNATDGSSLNTGFSGFYSYNTPAFCNDRIYLVSKTGQLSVFANGSNPDNLDIQAPQVTEITPANGWVISTNRPEISARIVDDISGFNASAAILKVDGTKVFHTTDSLNNRIYWTPATDLTNGIHTISLTVSDVKLNSTTIVWSFTIDYTTDTAPPVITLLQPSSGETISLTQFPEILVHVKDYGTSGLDLRWTTISLDGKNLYYTYNEATDTLSAFPENPLMPATHSLLLRAKDKAGNEAQPINATFTVLPTTDTTPPTYTTLTPLNGAVINDVTTPLISAAISDPDSGINEASISLIVDGSIVNHSFDSQSGVVSFQPTTSLTNGLHNCQLLAEDKPGNTIKINWSFTIDFKLTFSPIRIASISDTTAIINWQTIPASTGFIVLSSNSDLSNPTILQDTLGDTHISEMHQVKITGLTNNSTYYVRPKGSVSSLQFDSSETSSFTTLLPISGTSRTLNGKVTLDNLPTASALVYLTIQHEQSYSLPLSTRTNSSGEYSFDLTLLRNNSGTSMNLTVNDTCRISATAGSKGNGYLTQSLLEVTSTINIAELPLQQTLNYKYTLSPGINFLGIVLDNTGLNTSFDLLNLYPAITEVGHYRTDLQQYETAARVFSSPSGVNFPIHPNEGYYLRVEDGQTITISGNLTPSTSISLSPGLNLSRLPGSRQLPDNPSLQLSSKAFLTANNALSIISRFDAGRQFFDSTFILNGLILGDDFPLYHDNAYFLNPTTPLSITPAPGHFAALLPTSSTPAPQPQPRMRSMAATSHSALPTKLFTLGLLPEVAVGKILQPSNAPAIELPVTIHLISSGNQSAPLRATTDNQGYYHVNLANFKASTAFPVSRENLTLLVEFGNQSHRVLPEGKDILHMDTLIYEGGRF